MRAFAHIRAEPPDMGADLGDTRHEPAGKGSGRGIPARRGRAVDDQGGHRRFLGRMVRPVQGARPGAGEGGGRSEEHTSELQSLMRISYAVFCLKKKTNTHYDTTT